MRPVGWLSLVAVLAGAAMIVAAVALGQATVALVVVIPVVFGGSPLFAGGVGLVLLGLLGGMFGIGENASNEPRSERPTEGPEGPVRTGGLVLVGPVPIVWGTGVPISRRGRWVLAVLGGVLLLLALAVVWGAR